ncbi:MAG: hypothetical protein Q9227_006723 [Pyrenula ochraceoflavens]
MKYNLEDQIEYNSRVNATIWDDSIGKWRVLVQQDGKEIETYADILINASGVLNKWQWPDIEDLGLFRGKLIHTAAWDRNLDWSGKRIALLGNGSSGIQVLPQLQQSAGRVVTYIRSPTWLTPQFAGQLTPNGKNFSYSEKEREDLRQDPEKLLMLRKKIETNINDFFHMDLVETVEQQEIAESTRKQMESRLHHDPELCSKLIPHWKLGCRRFTPGEGYLEALQESNVSIEFNEIQRITESGILTAVGHQDFDIIVCATGFDVSFVPFWTVVGKNEVNLAEQWRENPEAYLGICAPNMPNYFMFNGPNSPVHHGSLLASMEWTAEYILKWCDKIAREDIR